MGFHVFVEWRKPQAAATTETLVCVAGTQMERWDVARKIREECVRLAGALGFSPKGHLCSHLALVGLRLRPCGAGYRQARRPRNETANLQHWHLRAYGWPNNSTTPRCPGDGVEKEDFLLGGSKKTSPEGYKSAGLRMGQGTGIVEEQVVAAYNASTPYECQFESQLQHFLSSPLLMCLRKQWEMTQVLGPLQPTGETQLKFVVIDWPGPVWAITAI